MRKAITVLLMCVFMGIGLCVEAEPYPEIKRVLPTVGKPLSEGDQAKVTTKLDELGKLIAEIEATDDGPAKRYLPDVEVFHKAVRFALELDEFYKPGDVAKAMRLLDEGIKRANALKNEKAPWLQQTGLVVRGYRSKVDGSVQPYGLVIPEGFEAKNIPTGKQVPLYVWLHGRGVSVTDMHFIDQRMNSKGVIAPKDAVVLHPFGRQCIGFKSAGEIDVIDAVDHFTMEYPVDAERVVMMGFSMGGGGAWHMGAHYVSRWCAVGPGAGFSEMKEFIRLKEADYPPAYEQALWGVYDVPYYTQNLFNVPTVVYSGEKDKQIQAARVMEREFLKYGQVLPHIIGKNEGHKYTPEALAEMMGRMGAAVKNAKVNKRIQLQTQTLRYGDVKWVKVLGVDEHWRDTRVDATFTSEGSLVVNTQNVKWLRIDHDWLRSRGYAQFNKGFVVHADGKMLVVEKPGISIELVRGKGASDWKFKTEAGRPSGYPASFKYPGMQGPMDDAVLGPFMVVLPTGDYAANEGMIKQWVDFELKQFAYRWRAVFRGELQTIKDVDVTEEHLAKYHLIAWGTPSSNALIKKLMVSNALPVEKRFGGIKWGEKIVVGEQTFDSAHHVLMGARDNVPLAGGDSMTAKYIVLNSGPTFREVHDLNNSEQNPRLPDYAVVDVRVAPDRKDAGKVVAAGFFDEFWQLKTK